MPKPENGKNLTVENDIASICSLIDMQWKDIHHSRNQDWQYWAILGIIIAAIYNNFKDLKDTNIILYLLIGIGGVISLWAAAIAWSHWILHIRRISYIKWFESHIYLNGQCIDGVILDTEEKNKKNALWDPFRVCGLIFSIYLTLAITFIIISILICTNHFDIQSIKNNPHNNLIPIGFIVFGFGCICLIEYISGRYMKKRQNNILKTIKVCVPKDSY